MVTKVAGNDGHFTLETLQAFINDMTDAGFPLETPVCIERGGFGGYGQDAMRVVAASDAK